MSISNTCIDSFYCSPFIETNKRAVVITVVIRNNIIGEFMFSCSLYRLKNWSHLWAFLKPLRMFKGFRRKITLLFMTWYYMSPDYIIRSILTPPSAPRPFTHSWHSSDHCKRRWNEHILNI